MLTKPIIFLPYEDPDYSNTDKVLKIHVKDSVKLHIQKLASFLEYHFGVKEFLPQNILILGSDLPWGEEAVLHLTQTLNIDGIQTKAIEGLAFDFEKTIDKRKFELELTKVWTEIKTAAKDNGCELMIMIGDNTFPFAIKKLQLTGLSFLEFSQNGKLVPVVVNDSTKKNDQLRGHIPTLHPERAYYTGDNRVAIIKGVDTVASGKIFTGHLKGNEDEIHYWFEDGIHPQDEGLRIVHMKT